MMKGERDMSRQPVELRAVIDFGEKGELVQTGIYVFSDTTIAQIRELMENGIKIEGVRYPVAYVEIDMKDKEEEE